MAEDSIQKDVREINYRLTDTEKSVGLLLRARRQEVIVELMESCFRKSVEKVKVFLTIDGNLSVKEIADKLGLLINNVSRHMKDFSDHDLIVIKNVGGGKVIYDKTSQVRRLRLDKYLQETFKAQLLPKVGATETDVDSSANENQNPIAGP